MPRDLEAVRESIRHGAETDGRYVFVDFNEEVKYCVLGGLAADAGFPVIDLLLGTVCNEESVDSRIWSSSYYLAPLEEKDNFERMFESIRTRYGLTNQEMSDLQSVNDEVWFDVEERRRALLDEVDRFESAERKVQDV